MTCIRGCSELAQRPPIAARQSALKLPGMDRGRQSVAVKEREKDVQARIVAALRVRGYIVWETSERRTRVQCPTETGCGRWFTPHGGRPGVTKGVSDLLVRNPRWPRWVFAAIEVKGTNSASRQEQIKLAQDGAVRIVWSVEDALAAMEELDALLLD